MADDVSNWVEDTSVDPYNNSKLSEAARTQIQSLPSAGDWQEEETPKTQAQPKESLLASIAQAPLRLRNTALTGIYNALTSIPSYYKTAKTELPGIPNVLKENPLHALGQFGAGLGEMGQSIFDIPANLSQYGTETLHLVPENFNKWMQTHAKPDITQDINATFGPPLYPGEKAIRGTARNMLNVLGTVEGANVLNPNRLTNRAIANDVVNEGRRQMTTHSVMYNQLWNDAAHAGINNVRFDTNLVRPNYQFIEQYTTPLQHQSLNEFMQHPTLPNAQVAVSDLRQIRRNLEEKSRTTSLTGEERNLHNAVTNTERHIEDNMFRDANGNLNQPLSDRYRAITNSYRRNVVPYRYNPDIQAYINEELTAEELVPRLGKGEFGAKKTRFHPALKIRNAIIPTAKGIGIIGGVKYLYDKMFGEQLPENKQ